MSDDLVWVVSLQDGTAFVELDERPIIALLKRDTLEYFDEVNGSKLPTDCTNDAEGNFEAHIHIKDLLDNSYYRDETQAGLTAMDFGGPASMNISDPNASWNLPK